MNHKTNTDGVELYTALESATITEAMKLIDRNAVGLLYVTDERSRLIGCLTDGDIRRWIINTGDLYATAGRAMNHHPKYVHEDEEDSIDEIMLREGIYSVAVVDNNMSVKKVVFLDAFVRLKEHGSGEALKGIPVIVMAGGKGVRLYPYTKILPKPLIPVGDVPIIERIMDRFAECGTDRFFVTVNYKREMIKAYFSDLHQRYSISFIDEDKPLGTAGSIRLIKERFETPVIITNCDILIEADYEKILREHETSGNDITIVSSLKNTVIPYGVLHTGEEGIITSMEEKPQLSHLINTGMYIINPEFLEWIPEDKEFHMTELVELMIKENKRVGMFPIGEDSFLDMGEFEELKRMEERLNR